MKKTIITIIIFIAVFLGSLIITFFIGSKYLEQKTRTVQQVAPSTQTDSRIVTSPSASPKIINQKTYDPLTSLSQLRLESPPLKDNNLTSILVTGDVLLARSVNLKMTEINDFTWPFQKTMDRLRNADITFINLETPLVKDCPLQTDGMVFCGDERGVEGLQFAGIDVANVANNHAGNWGAEGVSNTQQVLGNAGIKSTGVDTIPTQHVKGITFGFLGFNEVNTQAGIPALNESLLRRRITDAKAKSDVVIVQFHWGQEYTYQPTTNQKKWAHLAIDDGADLVVGNHPHWWQPAEFYKDKLIVYSHGNFVFDQMWSYETREGIVGEYFFNGKNLVDVKFHPVLIEAYGQPQWLDGEEKDKVLKHFIDESKRISLPQ